jgi:hypothetical protein
MGSLYIVRGSDTIAVSLGLEPGQEQVRRLVAQVRLGLACGADGGHGLLVLPDASLNPSYTCME